MGIDLTALSLAKQYTDKKIEQAELGEISLDTTLTKSGFAADAKAVGDAINNIDIFANKVICNVEIDGETKTNVADVLEALAAVGNNESQGSGGLNLPLLYEATTTEEVRWIDTGNAFEVKNMLIVELTSKETTTNEASKPGSGSFRSSSSADIIYPYSNYALARSVKELLAMQYDRRFTSISIRGNDGLWTTIWQVRTTANSADATPYMQTSGFNQNITGVVIGDAAAMGDTRHMGIGSKLRVWGC